MFLNNKHVQKFDRAVIKYTKRFAIPFARFAIFLVYFWFGALKVFSTSPANPLVSALLSATMPFMTFHTFIILFGLFEMLIGVVFLIPRMERLAVLLLILHLVTTVMPLVLLPGIAWQRFMVPTLEGQYIIKNILIVALAISIFAHVHTLEHHEK